MMKSNVIKVLEMTEEKMKNCLGNEKLRLKKSAFTRKIEDGLGAKKLLHLILLRMYRALQLCIDDLYEKLDEKPITKQAVSKARMNLNPEYVREFFDETAKIAAEDDTLPAYKGMRIIAIDGSTAALENTYDLKENFGCSGSKKDAATALISMAYGPLDNVIYDCRIDKYASSERDLAKLHINRLCELGLSGSLILVDRGYPSAEFISYLYEKGFHFVMRVREKWNLEADNTETEKWISVTHNGKKYPVRVIKVTLPTGEIETLLTSLSEIQLQASEAGTLYFERWKIEVAYDFIKSKLQLENFSGKKAVSVNQDFYATMYLGNLVAFVAGLADNQISEKDAESPKKYKYPRKANRNRTIAKLRERFISLLLEPDGEVREAMLQKIVDDVAKYPLSIKPNRVAKRKSSRSKRFHSAKKPVV